MEHRFSFRIEKLVEVTILSPKERIYWNSSISVELRAIYNVAHEVLLFPENPH